MDSQTQSVFTLDCRTSNRRNTEIPSEEKLQDEEDRLNKSEHCIQHACLVYVYTKARLTKLDRQSLSYYYR